VRRISLPPAGRHPAFRVARPKNLISVDTTGLLMEDAETRFTPNGTAHTRFSLATSVSWKDKDSGEYKTRTEWHRIVVWGKFGEWAGSLKKGAFIEAEGELRYREFQPNGSDPKTHREVTLSPRRSSSCLRSHA
jgi:single-strand DNA-binding protein